MYSKGGGVKVGAYSSHVHRFLELDELCQTSVVKNFFISPDVRLVSLTGFRGEKVKNFFISLHLCARKIEL